MTTTPGSRAAAIRTTVVALVGPIAVSIVTALLLVSWLPDLPDPVAVHWAVDDRPDGFAPPELVIGLFAAIGLGVPILMGGIVRASLRPAGPSATHKILALVSGWVTVLLAGTALGSLGAQRGLEDAAEVGGVLPALAAAAGIATALAAAGWFVLPPTAVETDRSLELPDEPPLSPTERAAWRATATLAPGVLALIIAVIVGFAIIGVMVVAIAPADGWPVVIAPLGLLLLLLTTSVWRVRVDARGLGVRSALGWPAFSIALDDIVTVRAVTVQPLADFGGWGLRRAPGRRFGVVVVEGPAIEVERRDGRRFLVTVPAAGRGAALLRALRERLAAPPQRRD
jgi:hypothetical protein